MKSERIVSILIGIIFSESQLVEALSDYEKVTKLKQAFDSIEIPVGEFKETATDDIEYKLGLGNEDVNLNISQLIVKYKYPVQEYKVVTEDGYILTIVRIPNSGPPVLLIPGLLCCGDQFIIAGPKSGLAYRLASEGYDVWLGNYRGTKYSREHVYLSPNSDNQYWNFSWHEVGFFDLPAIIDFVLNKTEHSDLIYAGHSQGTTSFFVLCSERPEYNKKIKFMVSLSTVAYMTHIKSPVGRVITLFVHEEEFLTDLIGQHEFLPSDIFTRTVTSLVCGKPLTAAIICNTLVFSACGFDYPQMNFTNLPVLFSHFPCGSSTKQIIHYAQLVESHAFRQYDNGKAGNKIKYGTEEPPSYDVSKITVPVAIFYSDNDWLSNFTDVKTLIDQMPNIVEVYNVPFKSFSHLDYLWARDLNELVNNKFLELVKKYT
ncbi:hypothetical protein K1T71_001567 [Dendrolimus kikuchii]|uniref:Uncharacterized protein n=1 Tax=Dendrolimus kikuchii TaxID=765133 RepID=A0ACC1DE16_9NEOP|nr:hypothetical protein K1T71_001567 [Dendrolimus kikuchii]